MLLEFACSNHKSIKDKIVFSALAGKDNLFEEELTSFQNKKILTTAAIYGANGSGKSNLIDAIVFMKDTVLSSIFNQPGEGLEQKNHKLLDLSTESEYFIQFVKNEIRYVYGFSLKETLVYTEELYYFPRGRGVKIFERKENEFVPGDRFKGKFESCKDVLKPNRLLLSCAANFSAVEEIESVFEFFRDDLIIYQGFGLGDWMDYSLHKIYEDENMKEVVTDFIKSFGTDIKGFDVTIDKQSLNLSELPPFLSDEFKNQILKRDVDRIKAIVEYDKFSINLLEESTGIRKLVEFLCPMIDILIHGKVLFCDELEVNIHESIVCEIVNLFKNANKNSAQLFFTTHNTNLLNLSLFRRDQIWFTELKQETRETDLYSLAEIKNVRKDENIKKGYISGKYGAIPMLNKNLADIINSFYKEDINE